jgi:NitT/TauT family transport system permease protein
MAVIQADLKRLSGAARGRAALWRWAPALVTFFLGLGLWEGVVRLFKIAVYLLPAPSVIVARLLEKSDFLLGIGFYTFQEALFGFLIGCSLGVLAAVLSVRWGWLASGLLPFSIASSAVPIIALAPLVGVWFGSTTQASKIVIVAIMTFFPTLINTYRGLISPTPAALELLRSYPATPAQVFLKLRVPAALPFLFNALKISTTLSIIGAVVSEYFGGPLKALGVYIISQASIGHYDEAWAAIIVACGLGIAFYLVIGLAERLAMPWHTSDRE